MNRCYEQPEELLRRLIQFDTTNPPGNEIECVRYINSLLTTAGFETTLLEKYPKRANLLTRLAGQGKAPPLLFYGHVDVVTTAAQTWSYPPFAGMLADGLVWGRGTLDMKGGIAMMLAAILRAKCEGFIPAGDIILAILSDEETGGECGSKFLVEKHPEQFTDARYAIGEFGGFPLYFAGKKFYAIQVAEKQICWLKATLRGPGGHASLPMRGGAMAKLGRVLRQLDERRLPVHILPVVQQMLETMSAVVPAPADAMLAQLLDPAMTDQILDKLGPRGAMFDPMLHNVVNATIVQGGEKINVIPSQITLALDCRMLPGYGPADAIAEIHQIIGDEIEIEVTFSEPGPAAPVMGLFDTLAAILQEADPGSLAVPLLLPASSDARIFSRLGIQTYGFLPMNLPSDFNFVRRIHAADECIPVESVQFGAEAIYQLLQRYTGIEMNA
ncbi:MAG: M20/M25/M40 family metallo-hydrolase [Deltaproteobacteria bacterium]|nr:M20/M25/M40 family metallo-hydrolase [Deltaproteobacteria bacterium]